MPNNHGFNILGLEEMGYTIQKSSHCLLNEVQKEFHCACHTEMVVKGSFTLLYMGTKQSLDLSNTPESLQRVENPAAIHRYTCVIFFT